MLQLNSFCQSLPMYSQYMYNMTSINPAYAGSGISPSVAVLWKEQWAGLPGAPSTKSISLDLPSKMNKYGFGVQLFDDRFARVVHRTGANLFYNIKIPVSENGLLSLGLKGGFYNDTKDLTNINLGPVSTYDPAFSNNVNDLIPLGGAGVYYNNKHFFVGFSAPDVITFSKAQKTKTDSTLSQINQVHYFLTSGYTYDLNDEIKIKPSILLKATSYALLQVDFNVNVWLQNLVGLGASYRTESFLAMAEVQVNKKFRVGYAYDMPFKSANTSELILSLNFGKEKLRED